MRAKKSIASRDYYRRQQEYRRGDGSAPTECNLYYFKPTDADRLDFGAPFTGNFKANIATFNGNVGVNPQITTVLTNSPEEARTDASLLVWNKVDLGVTAMAGICDNTFDGVIPNYAKDNVWVDVDMGAPDVVKYFTGGAGQLPVITWSNDFALELDVISNSLTGEQWLLGDWNDSGVNHRAVGIRFNSGSLQVYISDNGVSSIQVAEFQSVDTTKVNKVKLEVGNGFATAWLNGIKQSIVHNSGVHNSGNQLFISTKNGTSRELDGSVLALLYTNNLNSLDDRSYVFDGTNTILIDTIGGNNGSWVGGTAIDYFVDDKMLQEVVGSGAFDFLTARTVEFIPLAGQSNMIGRSTIQSGIDDDYTEVSGRVNQFGYGSQTVKPATNPLDHQDDRDGSMGSWLEMCNSIQGDILLVPVARGGTGFITNNWNKGDLVYENAISSINTAFLSSDLLLPPKAIVWLQGETDCDNSNVNYLADLTQMRLDMIADTNCITTATHWVVVHILGSSTPAFIPNINEDLDSFAASIPNGNSIITSDLSLFDAFHFDSPSQRVIGDRISEVING